MDNHVLNPKQNNKPGGYLGRSLKMNVLFASEAGISFIFDIAIAATLGLGVGSDAFYVAFIIPQFIGRGIFQSITNSFLGIFSAENFTDNHTITYNQSISVIALSSLTLSVFLYISSFVWIPLILQGSPDNVVTAAISFTEILAWTIFFLALVETFRAIHYRESTIYIPSLARILSGIIAIGIILIWKNPSPGYKVAWAVLISTFLEMVFSYTGLHWREHLRYHLSWPNNSRLRRMAAIVGVPLVSQGIRVLTRSLEYTLASMLSIGSITALSISMRIINIIEAFIFRGFTITTISTEDKYLDLKNRIQTVALLGLPIAVLLGSMPQPIVSFFFERGNFDVQSVEHLASVLQAYAPAVIGLGLISIPIGMLYKNLDSRGIFLFSISISWILLLAEAIFILLLGWSEVSFGISYTIATYVTVLWLYPYVTKRKIPEGLSYLPKYTFWLKLIATGLLVGLLVDKIMHAIPLGTENILERFSALIMGVFVALLLIFLIGSLFGLRSLYQTLIFLPLSRNRNVL